LPDRAKEKFQARVEGKPALQATVPQVHYSIWRISVGVICSYLPIYSEAVKIVEALETEFFFDIKVLRCLQLGYPTFNKNWLREIRIIILRCTSQDLFSLSRMIPISKGSAEQLQQFSKA
jgi:hypothetical protein